MKVFLETWARIEGIVQEAIDLDDARNIFNNHISTFLRGTSPIITSARADVLIRAYDEETNVALHRYEPVTPRTLTRINAIEALRRLSWEAVARDPAHNTHARDKIFLLREIDRLREKLCDAGVKDED